MSFYKTTWTGIIGLKQLNYVMDYCRILQAFSVTIDSSFKFHYYHANCIVNMKIYSISYLSSKCIGLTAFILSCGSVGSFAGSLNLIFPSTESLEQS